MKALKLNEMNLVELNSEEIEQIDGGWWQAVLAAIIISAVNNFGDIRNGLSDGYNGTPRY